MSLFRCACGHVDKGTCPHQFLTATLTLSQPGGQIMPTLYTGVHTKFWKPQARLYEICVLSSGISRNYFMKPQKYRNLVDLKHRDHSSTYYVSMFLTLFRPTHLISRPQHFFIPFINIMSAIPHYQPPSHPPIQIYMYSPKKILRKRYRKKIQKSSL